MKNIFTLKGSFIMYFLTLCILSVGMMSALIHLSKIQEESYAATEYKIKALLAEAESALLGLYMIQAMSAFIVTGEPEFEKEYQRYQDMAKGKIQRLYGRTTTTSVLLKELGMPDNLVQGAFSKYSDEMYELEDTAYYASKGLYNDGQGNYVKEGPIDRALGINILFSRKYIELDRNSGAGMIKFLKDKIKESEARERKAEAGAFLAERIVYAMLLLMVVVSILALLLVYRMIRKSVTESLQVAELLATGDLTVALETDKEDELGRLMKAINGIGDGLDKVVGNVRSGVFNINSASREIARGNTNLADRTAQQASSLEKISRAMVQLTSTVQQNADNARQANQLVSTTADLAEKGGNAVDTVVQTMDGIKQSSARISEIISVIDGISFQTNILALNAAVEAARAGEQGRGFAVVASEVRVLAQRSAAAAKEISGLITDSVSKVTVGGQQVDQAGATMNEIVAAVRQVVDIMSEILAASKEQNEGIGQVSTAIGQMDEMTQQNSALVEQAAAASESLLDQADALEQAVKVFKTKEQFADHQRTSTVPTSPVTPPRTTVSKIVPAGSKSEQIRTAPVKKTALPEKIEPVVEQLPEKKSQTKTYPQKNEDGWDEF